MAGMFGTTARSLAFVVVGLSLVGCSRFLPKPEYSYVNTPAPIRTLPDGTRIDNRGYYLDANGYRLDRNGQILGMVDYSTKTDSSGSSNAVAGYYISSTGTVAAGSVAVPSEGAGVGPGSEYAPVTPATSTVPPGSREVVSPMAVPAPAATTAPIPLAPPADK